MKKILKAVVVVLGALPLVLCSCNLDPDRTCNIKSGSTELFSEEVLQEFDIPWLSKPEGAANEVQYKDGGTYYYDAAISSQEQFTSYVEDIFKEFSERNYTIANYYETIIKGEAWSTKYGFNIAFDNSKTYAVSQLDGITIFTLYFAAHPLGEYDPEVCGRVVTDVNMLKLTWRDDYNENLCNITIDLRLLTSDLSNYFLDEVPQEE